MTDCIVVGAGVIGCTIALQLQRAGYAVVLLDAKAPGAGASSGNAGMIGPNAVISMVTPGLLRQLPGLIFGSERSVLLTAHAGMSAMRWLGECLRMANEAQLRLSRDGLFFLNRHTLEDWLRLTGKESGYQLFSMGSTVSQHIAPDDDETLMNSLAVRLRREVGVTSRLVPKDVIQQCFPGLQTSRSTFTAVDGTALVTNPRQLLEYLVREFKSAGGDYKCCAVQRFEVEKGEITGLSGDHHRMSARNYILSAGSDSLSLLPESQHHFPLMAERGYHIMIKRQKPLFHPHTELGLMPCVLHDATQKKVISEMSDGIRVTGFVEYSSISSPEKARCYDRLEQHFRQRFPDYPVERLSRWYGHRPSTPDSLPYIGRHPEFSNLIVAFGHGHYGMSGAPGTAQLVQAIIDGKASERSLQPFNLQRFSGR